MIDPNFLEGLKRFHLIIRKRVASSYTGEHKSISLGRGLVIKDRRIYVPGDDFRTVDWKLFARTDRLHIKQFEEDKNLTVHVILDSSSSMDYGEKTSKFEYGAMIGLGFAYLTMKDNEKFEFTTFTDDLQLYRAKRGKKQLATMVNHLNQMKAKGLTNFEKVMTIYKKFINTKSLIIIISDFMYDLDQIEKGLSRFANHDLKIIQVLDHKEREMDMEGSVKLVDSESNQVLKTFISRRMKEKYLNNLIEHNNEIKNICNHMGAEFFSVTTNKPIFDTFYDVVR
jgi:uncharacterized protein (DUF58 family)